MVLQDRAVMRASESTMASVFWMRWCSSSESSSRRSRAGGASGKASMITRSGMIWPRTRAASATVSTTTGASWSWSDRWLGIGGTRLLSAAQGVGPAQRHAAMQALQRLAQALGFGGQAGDVGLEFRVAAFEIAVLPLQGVHVGPLAGHG